MDLIQDSIEYILKEFGEIDLTDQCIYRFGSDAWVELVNHVRSNQLPVNSISQILLESTDIGQIEYGHKLDVPFKTPNHPRKKYAVYTKNQNGNVVLVRFGDPNLTIKNCDPVRSKAFLARMRCNDPGPKYKPRWWSCNVHLFWKALDLQCNDPW